MTIKLSKPDKKHQQAYMDGIYLRSRRQGLKLREIIKEMNEALEYLEVNDQSVENKEATKSILEQKARAQTLLDMNNEATTWMGNKISEEETNGI
jgi:hypothetical protein